MIHYCVTRRHRRPPRSFLESWGRELRPRFRVVAYEGMGGLAQLPGGTYVFSDLERLLPIDLCFVKRLQQRLRSEPARYATLNDPNRWLARLELQHALRHEGFNAFRTFAATRIPTDLRFPVFLRRAQDHKGPLGGLLRDDAELRAALGQLGGGDRHGVLVVEYLHTADERGIFRKYSVMKIGAALVPRHILFSRDWVTKKPVLVDPELAAEEARFVEDFPERDLIGRVFRLAGVDYGRIDYAWREGRLQVWEVNTNPMVVPPPADIHPLRLGAQRSSAERILAAFEELLKLTTVASAGRGLPWPERLFWRAVKLRNRRSTGKRH